jgi:hypothetical protein
LGNCYDDCCERFVYIKRRRVLLKWKAPIWWGKFYTEKLHCLLGSVFNHSHPMIHLLIIQYAVV